MEVLVNPISDTNSSSHKPPMPSIITVRDLLLLKYLRLPDYQRPYKWTSVHVHQLIDDILFFRKKSAYRLGTLVLHQTSDPEWQGAYVRNIVDGQQRIVTILLLAYALWEEKPAEIAKLSRHQSINCFKPDLSMLRFRSVQSHQNIRSNYAEILRRAASFDEETISFFFERCEFVQVILNDISEAFQFFDAQNSRGKDLEPHDLLKAYHLREMGDLPEAERIDCIREWEDQDTEALAKLFSHYLYPIRQWARGNQGRYFTKADVGVFKGITPTIIPAMPYAELMRLGHHYVDSYNRHPHRNLDGANLTFPFQLNGIIINGKRFFEFVAYYKKLTKEVRFSVEHDEGNPGQNQATVSRIKKVLGQYGGKGRAGDQYVRRLFECALLYYKDRFGNEEAERAFSFFFVWAYGLRLQNYSVFLESIDNHARGIGTNSVVPIFSKLSESLHPSDLLQVPLPNIEKINGTRLEEVKNLFKDLKYYDDRQA